MKKFAQRVALAVLMCILGTWTAIAIGWPSNYQGVMLQGFYWDSYSETSWSKLEAQSDELSKYFKLIWIPNSAQASGNPTMGYMPIYWFSHYNSSFGTEAQLKSMIKAFKDKGTGMIADVVINHRVGVSNWGDFPTETWNGKTYSMGASDVCRTDEWSRNGGNPTGANDTGEDFSAARDLDHTGANVQNCCKDYCNFLLKELGYAGFRYDMVKGYSGQYTKMYNQASNVTYSVGEYWDGSYDAVAAWIEATGKTSAAFDFPFKYAVNDAFGSNDMTKLVWKANGTTNQPAGMIHFGYSQYAVTFIDNHDTYRDSNKFNGNVLAANAFMLMSPGTPCVFYPHYTANKAAIQKLIDVRNSVGLHNNSAVNVLQSNNNCYMAEVTGTKGKLVVKIGSAMVSPSGYTDADIVASGNDYCVWTKVTIGNNPVVDPDDPDDPTDGSMWLLGNLEGAAGWDTTPGTGVKMTANGNVYTAKGVKFAPLKAGEKCYFNFTDYVGTTWDDLNMNANRYGAATEGTTITPGTPAAVAAYPKNVSAKGCLSWAVDGGKYDVTLDLGAMTVTLTGQGDTPVIDPDDPTTDEHYIYYDGTFSDPRVWAWNDAGNCVESAWPGDHMTKKDGKWYWAVPATSSLPTGVIISDGNDNKIGGGDLVYVDKATYHQDGTYTGGSDPVDPDDPIDPAQEVTIYFDNSNSNWATPHIHYWGGSESTWPGFAMTLVSGNIWVYHCPAGTTGCLFNAGDGDATKTGDFKAINNHIYTTTGDNGEYGDDPIDPDDPTNIETPAHLYVIGTLESGNWDTANPVEMEKDDYLMVARVKLVAASATDKNAYFTLITTKGADWDAVNNGDRYGAPDKNTPLELETEQPFTKYPVNVSAKGAESWKVATPGEYYIAANFKNNTVKVSKNLISAVTEIANDADNDVAPVFYNLQGVRVDNPTTGLYIVVRGKNVQKVVIR